MDLDKVLAILDRVGQIIADLKAMGLTVNGTIDLSTILSFIPKK